MEEVGRKELLRDVGGAQGGEKVGRRVSTEQDSNADNSDQYRPGTTLRRTCRKKDMPEGLGRKVRGMVTLIMLMPVPIMLLIILLLQTNAIQPRYNLEEDVV